MNCLRKYFFIYFVNVIILYYGDGCFPSSSSDSSPDLVTGSMTGSGDGSGGTGTATTAAPGTLPNDPTCLCGTFPTTGNLFATPPIVIINPFTCLITVTLQCLPTFPIAQIVQFNGDTTPGNSFPTPPPFTVTCGGTGQYTYFNPITFSIVVVSSATCV